MSLRVFTLDHVYWLVAYSRDDAWAQYTEFSGETRDDYPDVNWELVDDDEIISILDADDFCQPLEKKPARQWAIERGRGFLCSTEY